MQDAGFLLLASCLLPFASCRLILMGTYLLCALWGYLIGAIPTGVGVARLFGGADVRATGSGHTGATNVARAAGTRAGLLTLGLDMLLGFLAVGGVRLLTSDPWAAAVAGICVVIGHNWSVYIRFAGGIGLAKYAGMMIALGLWQVWAVGLFFIGFWLLLTKKLHRHRARSTILGMALAVLLLWGGRIPLPALVQGALGALAVMMKSLGDWNRVYSTV
jgi:glycerol-3-phosphate acyltransferase PlsY